MKKTIFTIITILVSTIALKADYDTDTIRNKKNGGYLFTETTNIDHNIVQNQCRTGTCWSYSSLSFFESELIRMGKPKVNLSEMFIVRGAYIEKARNYIRMDGHFNFGQGGAFHDILYVMNKYGIVPESEYTGLNYGTDKHNHSEMSGMLKAQLDVVKRKPQGGKLTPNWIKAVKGTVEAYLGEAPEKFTFEGKEYTPISFRDYLGIVPADYVSLTSFTHHPFYSQFVIEVPDNWAMQSSYNLPLEELWEVMEYSLKNDYTFAWGSDVSEKGFSFRNGIGIVPMHDSLLKVKGKDNKHFSNAGSQKLGSAFDSPHPEKTITQKMRQDGFDYKTTTDDHGMHAVGLATDQNGNKYVKIKNSWGTPNYLKGYMFISEAYMKYKTINIQIHKDAIPKSIKKKLGIK
jgi:bleomycin hydrolase